MHGASALTPEPWPWPGPRVLIEHPEESAGMVLASALRQAGYAVAVCPGPAETERCPLSGPEGCSVAHGADVIVSSLGFDRVESRDVLQSLRTRLPDARLVVEVNAGRQNEWTDILQGCELVHAPATPDEVLSAVERALSRTA